jgi:membrane protein
MLLAPILLIIASSITVFMNTQIHWLVKTLHISANGSSLLLALLNYSPVLIMSGLFSFVFIFIPNQKIHWQAGMIAGVITGIIYQIVQAAYVNLQIGVSSYNAIYGSFTALPLFLVWLQLGWLMVLFGCELAFFIQNYASYQHNQTFSHLSFALKKVLAVQITYTIVQRFAKAQKALNCVELAQQLSLPIAVVQMILNDLIKCGILVAILPEPEGEVLFQPAQDIDLLTVYAVIERLENQGEDFALQMPAFEKINQLNVCFKHHLKNCAENSLLKELRLE